jgi:hypothetical protein
MNQGVYYIQGLRILVMIIFCIKPSKVIPGSSISSIQGQSFAGYKLWVLIIDDSKENCLSYFLNNQSSLKENISRLTLPINEKKIKV